MWKLERVGILLGDTGGLPAPKEKSGNLALGLGISLSAGPPAFAPDNSTADTGRLPDALENDDGADRGPGDVIDGFMGKTKVGSGVGRFAALGVGSVDGSVGRDVISSMGVS